MLFKDTVISWFIINNRLLLDSSIIMHLLPPACRNCEVWHWAWETLQKQSKLQGNMLICDTDLLRWYLYSFSLTEPTLHISPTQRNLLTLQTLGIWKSTEDNVDLLKKKPEENYFHKKNTTESHLEAYSMFFTVLSLWGRKLNSLAEKKKSKSVWWWKLLLFVSHINKTHAALLK